MDAHTFFIIINRHFAFAHVAFVCWDGGGLDTETLATHESVLIAVQRTTNQLNLTFLRCGRHGDHVRYRCPGTVWGFWDLAFLWHHLALDCCLAIVNPKIATFCCLIKQEKRSEGVARKKNI